MMRSHRIRKKLADAAVFCGLSLYTLFALGPILWIALMSLKSGSDIIAYPPKIFDFTPTLHNYVAVFTQSGFIRPLLNTWFLAFASVLVSLAIGLPAAYALARMKFRWQEDIAFSIISLRFAPELVVILPLFIIYKTLGLLNTFTGLVIAYQLITLPLIVWMARSFYEKIPQEIEEAVTVDGGGFSTVFVMFTRLSISGILAAGTLAFVAAWNSYALPLVLAGPDTEVVTSAMLGFMKFADVDWGQLAAAVVISIVPSFALTAVLVGRMVEGLTAGAVK